MLQTEIKNISLYGYGIKAFMLSMIETAIRITDRNIKIESIEKMVAIVQALLDQPVQLIEGVEDVLKSLKQKYKLVMATKGDLLEGKALLISSISSTKKCSRNNLISV